MGSVLKIADGIRVIDTGYIKKLLKKTLVDGSETKFLEKLKPL